jgi:anti-sigma factor RsiW
MKNTVPPIMRFMKGKMLKYVPGMITCVEFEKFIDDYLDEQLEPQQKILFERHIKLCRECHDYLAAYRQSIALGKAVFATRDAEDAEPEEVPTDLLQAILDATQANNNPKP